MEKLKRYLSVFLCIAIFLTSNIVVSVKASEEITHTGSVVNISSNLNVRAAPSADGKWLGALYNGDTVYIYNYNKDSEWHKIAFQAGTGYVSAKYVGNIKEIPKYDYDADFETNLTNQKFPESYKAMLRDLHAAHPNWVFMADHLTMTFKEAVDAESKVGHSLVQN